MDFNQKLDAAFRKLDRAGISRRSYAPLVFRVLWRLGVRIPPPHYSRFLSNFVTAGVYFGVSFGLGIWLITAWISTSGSLVLAAVVAGGLFGLAYAVGITREAGKKAIPHWKEFDAEVSGDAA